MNGATLARPGHAFVEAGFEPAVGDRDTSRAPGTRIDSIVFGPTNDGFNEAVVSCREVNSVIVIVGEDIGIVREFCFGLARTLISFFFQCCKVLTFLKQVML